MEGFARGDIAARDTGSREYGHWCDKRRLNPRPRLGVRERGKGSIVSIPFLIHIIHCIEVI